VETSKNGNYGDSVHLLFWPQLKLFVDIYDNCRKYVFSKTDYEDIFKFISRAFLAVSTANNSSHQFFRSPSLDPYIFSLPLKVSLFYAAFIEKAKLFLLDLEKGKNPEDTAKYEFLLSPEPFELIEVEECFRKVSSSISADKRTMDRLLYIRAAEHELYDPTFIFPLMHEIVHFVGAFTRQRDERYVILKDFVSKIIVESVWRAVSKYVKVPDEMEIKAIDAMVKIVVKKIGGYDEDIKSNMYGIYGSDLKENFTKYVCLTIIDSFEQIISPFDQVIWVWLRDCPDSKLFSLYQKSDVYKTTFVKDSLFKAEAAGEISESMWHDLYKIQTKLTFASESNGTTVDTGIYFDNSDVPSIRMIVDDFIYLCGEIYADLIAICSLGVSVEFYLREIHKQGDLFEGLTFARVYTVLCTLRNKENNKVEGFHCDDIWSISAVKNTIANMLGTDAQGRSPAYRNLSKISKDVWYLNSGYLRESLLTYAEKCYIANTNCIDGKGDYTGHDEMKCLFRTAQNAPNIVDAIIEQEHLLRTYMRNHEW